MFKHLFKIPSVLVHKILGVVSSTFSVVLIMSMLVAPLEALAAAPTPLAGSANVAVCVSALLMGKPVAVPVAALKNAPLVTAAAEAAALVAAAAAAKAAAAALSVPTSDLAGVALSGANVALLGGIVGSMLATNVADTELKATDTMREGFFNCVARAIAKMMLQQITISTVNWINGGFKGQPSFVQNFELFFTNIADQVAGGFLQGSALAFLCAPFKLEIKIAIANVYMNYSRTPSCTLTGALANIDKFVADFNKGGWQSFMRFTTLPTNNPYGAFIYADAALRNRLAGAAGGKSNEISVGGGFLSPTQNQNCSIYYLDKGDEPPFPGPGQAWYTDDTEREVTICDVVTVTPGTAIAASLNKTLGMGQDSLIEAKYFDEIITALISQLVIKVMQSGLTTMSSGAGYGFNTFGLLETTPLSATIEVNAPIYKKNAQDLIDIYTQDIANIQGVLPLVDSTQQCWDGIVASTNPFFTLESKDAAIASSTQASSASLDLNTKKTGFQTGIDAASASITLLDQYIASSTGIANTPPPVTAVTAAVAAAISGVANKASTASTANVAATALTVAYADIALTAAKAAEVAITVAIPPATAVTTPVVGAAADASAKASAAAITATAAADAASLTLASANAAPTPPATVVALATTAVTSATKAATSAEAAKVATATTAAKAATPPATLSEATAIVSAATTALAASNTAAADALAASADAVAVATEAATESAAAALAVATSTPASVSSIAAPQLDLVGLTAQFVSDVAAGKFYETGAVTGAQTEKTTLITDLGTLQGQSQLDIQHCQDLGTCSTYSTPLPTVGACVPGGAVACCLTSGQSVPW